MWAPDRIERPTTSTSSCTAAVAIISGRLVQPGVDHLHPGVAQRGGHHLGAAVVPVEPRLGHEHADGPRQRAVGRSRP